MSDDSRGESGTTLVELLVVIVLMGIVGTVTTAGIVAGFRAQLDAANVAETLDGMRLATQRVRDFTREADEVCTSSTSKSLVLWTDDDDDGVVESLEKDIFELDTTVTPPVFQRSVPGTSEVQIIRDDILDDAIFQYDDFDLPAAGDPEPATMQPMDLACQDGPGATGAASPIRSVKVTFIVDHPDPSGQDLTTSTRVRIRNADLIEEPNNAPVADFDFSCTNETCEFDASASTDPDGTISTYTWDFDDGFTDSGLTTSHTYVEGGKEYQVTLLVVDDEGAVDTVQKPVVPGKTGGNADPVAEFTYSCDGRSCDFTDTSTDSDGTITNWIWGFGDGAASTAQHPSHTYGADGTYSVTLTVTDDLGASDSETRSVVASDSAMRVESLDATVNDKTNHYDVTFTIELSLTKELQHPGDGITVSVQLDGGKTRTDSCSTNTSSVCTIEIKSVPQADAQSLRITNLTDSTGTYTYDPNQDKVDQIVVDKIGNVTLYKDGEEVTP